MSKESEFLLYTAPDGNVKVEVLFKPESVWLLREIIIKKFVLDDERLKRGDQVLMKDSMNGGLRAT